MTYTNKEEKFWRGHLKSRRIIDVEEGGGMKIKGKRYDYPDHEAMMIDVEKFVKAGDIIYTNANPNTGEYWLQVILIGGKVKKELPNVT